MKLANIYLMEQINECLMTARVCLVSRVPARNFRGCGEAEAAKRQLEIALGYARQLTDIPKHRVIRAHIAAALEAWHD